MSESIDVVGRPRRSQRSAPGPGFPPCAAWIRAPRGAGALCYSVSCTPGGERLSRGFDEMLG
eukprot:2871385-Pyramimonas_sp.AAC.1